MNVAVSILNNSADTGLGIRASARALNLDFIPVATEQYDLIVPSDILDDPKIQLLINLIRSEDFRKRVKALGGYDANMSGNLWKII